MARSSGILMHISSLPGKYGIGTLGKSAYEFADFLKRSKQAYWQLLPLGPTSFGDSPYQSFSTFAGNPYFIDLETLVSEGLLLKAELDACDWGDNEELVDYGKVYGARFDMLRIAYSRGYGKCEAEVCAFAEENSQWIYDYAFYMALKKHFSMRSWLKWDDERIRGREPEAMKEYSVLLKDDIRFFTFIQYLFFKQWKKLHAYVKSLGIRLIGDLPIYVPFDSSDVWACPKDFLLDSKLRPSVVGGVPPDYFSADGQLWGTPLYDWAYMKKDGFAWWKRRIGAAAKLYDVIRIDHFRGLESYWEIPFGAATAREGRWVKGPGMEFINIIKREFPTLNIIAEDLGYLTADVREMVKQSGFPGMKVLQFAFDSREPSNYLPHTYSPNCVCFTGTHDNTTAAGWFTDAYAGDVAYAHEYLGLTSADDKSLELIRAGMASVAELFMAQMQDYLGLGGEYRMNTPGTLGGTNWRWRMKNDAATDELADRIARMTVIYGRAE